MSALRDLNLEGVSIVNDILVNNAFNQSKIEKLTLPISLKSIGTNAFANYMINSLNIFDLSNLEFIDNSAFHKLSNIETLDFLKCLKLNRFGSSGVFTEYKGHVILPENMVVIPRGIFRNFIGSVDLDDKITVIGDFAFQNSNPKNGIKLPKSLTYIGNATFAGSSIKTYCK